MCDFHFTHPFFLLVLLFLPCVWILYFLFYKQTLSFDRLQKFVDPHLLPYLISDKELKQQRSKWKTLLLWSLVWILGSIALAGPRWNEREVETFSKDQTLVILLDLSESMNATDIKPSRLLRAKQKIEDLLNEAKGIKIGLVAFAADPHMITPLTEDINAIKHFLPSLDSSLVYVQGSRLSPTFDMVMQMLKSEDGNNKAILLISDGGFEDLSSALATLKKNSEKIPIYTLGVGTSQGAPLTDHSGNIIKKEGSPVISRLEKDNLKALSDVSLGSYFEATPLDHSEKVILKNLHDKAEAQALMGKKRKIFEEGFYLFLLPLIPIFLWWFKRGSLLSLMFVFVYPHSLNADFTDYFKNSEQKGQKAFEQGDFEAAEHSFQDPYRKGVASYRKGNFAEAENYFRESTRQEVACSTIYNLGNSLAQQGKYPEAIEAYETLLKQWPNHERAKENIQLLKELLKEQNNTSQKNENSQKENDEQKKQDTGDSEKKNNESQDQKKNSEESREDQRKEDQQNRSQPQNNDTPEKKKEEPQQSPAKETQEQNQKNSQNTAEKQAMERQEEKQSEKEQDAEMMLRHIDSDPKEFMKNKFILESKKKHTTEGSDPW